MKRHKTITAFLPDGSIVVDKKAYLKADFIVSEKNEWLVPPLKPTRGYRWRKEGSRPARLQGTEYLLMSQTVPADHHTGLLETLSKIWEEAVFGKRVKTSAVSDSFKLQIVIALAGAVFLLGIMVLWFMVSQNYELPPIPDIHVPEVPVAPGAAAPGGSVGPVDPFRGG